MIKNKRIALFMLPLLTNGGGAEKYFINLACELRKHSYQADVITLDDDSYKTYAFLANLLTGQWKSLIKLNINFFKKINISGRETKEQVIKELGQAKWVRVNLQSIRFILKQYDVIYSKNEIIDLLLLKIAGIRHLPPIIVGIHTPIYYQKPKYFFSKLHNFIYMGVFYRWLLEGTKLIHLSNRFTQQLVNKKFRIKNTLIYYPFSIADLYHKLKNYQSPIKFKANKFNLIFLGRLTEQKGTDLLVNLIKIISQTPSLVNKICLNIFGTGDKFMEEKIRKLTIKYQWLKYYGHIENRYIPAILNKQHLLISLSKWETLPYSILEAQAMGLPVIAFDIPGPNDIIIDKETGFLVKNEDEFLNKLSQIIEKSITFNKTSIIENINNKFSSQLITNQLINMFDRVIHL